MMGALGAFICLISPISRMTLIIPFSLAASKHMGQVRESECAYLLGKCGGSVSQAYLCFCMSKYLSVFDVLAIPLLMWETQTRVPGYLCACAFKGKHVSREATPQQNTNKPSLSRPQTVLFVYIYIYVSLYCRACCVYCVSMLCFVCDCVCVCCVCLFPYMPNMSLLLIS